MNISFNMHIAREKNKFSCGGSSIFNVKTGMFLSFSVRKRQKSPSLHDINRRKCEIIIKNVAFLKKV